MSDMQQADEKKVPSIWKQGAKASIVLTISFAIATFHPNMFEFFGPFVIAYVVVFLLSWVLCAGIVWLWRKRKTTS